LTPGDADALYYAWDSGASSNMKSLKSSLGGVFGRLPEFTYISPSCVGPDGSCALGFSNMYPTALLSDGEVLLKQLYDALRTAPSEMSHCSLIPSTKLEDYMITSLHP
jgi:phospholipase C